MRITVTQPLFAWAALEDSPSLETVRRCLEAIPDAPCWRDCGRRGGGTGRLSGLGPLGRRRVDPPVAAPLL